MRRGSVIEKTENPFVLQVHRKAIPGIKTGLVAMQAAGIQPEFVNANLQQLSSLNCTLILRSSYVPVHNKPRSPKSGLNLSKTSNQGFFKGSLAKDVIFTRLHNGNPLGHSPEDQRRLQLSIKNIDYQHTVQLTINMLDIIKEIRPEGDLEVLAYEPESEVLRLAYKENKGPTDFHGQFLVFLQEGITEQQFFSRPWDSPENDANWSSEQKLITKPAALTAISDTNYRHFFHKSFALYYCNDKNTISEIKPALVFANTPRSCRDFMEAMGADHPEYSKIAALKEKTIPEELAQLLDLLNEQTIRDVYNKSALIVAGDWDGLALSQPYNLKPEYGIVYNTMVPDLLGQLGQMEKLIDSSEHYLLDLQHLARQKNEHSPFEKLLLSIKKIEDIITPFAVAHAGCITPHEFLFQQLLNYGYRDNAHHAFREPINLNVLQKTMDEVLQCIANQTLQAGSPEFNTVLLALFRKNWAEAKEKPMNVLFRGLLEEHLQKHAEIACAKKLLHYTIPHPQYEHNIQNLYQHGFDMRNPFGTNMNGAWFMITAEGGLIYGETENQLIQVLLTGNFIENHPIAINHHANMSMGWGEVIARQIEYCQPIPEATLEQYNVYVNNEMQIQLASSIVPTEGAMSLEKAKEILEMYKKHLNTPPQEQHDINKNTL